MYQPLPVKKSAIPSSRPQPQQGPLKHIPKIDISVESLPSKSLPYPDKCEIKYRAYTFGEVKTVSQAKMNHKDTFDFILNGIYTSFDKYLLTLQDVLFIGFLRKMSTFGDTKISAESECSKCGHKNKFDIDTEKDLEFNDIEVDELPIIAELESGTELEFTPMTARDIIKLMDHGDGVDEIDFMAAQCRNFDFKTSREIVYNASPTDARILAEVDRMMSHGLKPVERPCVCGEKITITLDTGGTDHQLVLPFRQDEKSFAGRIRVGKRAAH